MNSLRSTSIQLQLRNLHAYQSCRIPKRDRILARGVQANATRRPPGSLALAHRRRWASSDSQPSKKSADMPWILISGVLTAGFVAYIMYSPKADKKAHDIVEEHVRQEKYVMPGGKDSDKDEGEGKEVGGSDKESSESSKDSEGSENSEEKSKDKDKGKEEGKGKSKSKSKDDSSDEDKSEKKDTPNPQEGQDDIKESGKDDKKSPKERRGESFEKDNSNQANKGRGAGSGSGGGSTPREVESSEGKKGGGQRKDVK